ncbi:MAG: TIGR02757 family protein [Deltaproteobacteria bacterium]|nr:MAG: TIGR02757 family protein [Deltaproteobacteria bacterium]
MPRLPLRRVETLRQHLDALIDATDLAARTVHDPVSYPRRYTDPRDQEIAGLYAASLAFGKVDLFRRPLDAWFDWLDRGGGPYARTLSDFEPEAGAVEQLYYRWARGPDLIALMAGARTVIREQGSLEALFGGPGPVRDRLGRAVSTLRDATGSSPISRGLGYLLASPAGGSACKRWNLFLRWMVRPAEEGVDLGIWRALDPADLVLPVDTHVLRICTFLGLTQRRDASWRTALELTEILAQLCPGDPVRYDFALAQLGISGRCLGYRDPLTCPSCPLDRLCAAGSKGSATSA